MRILHVVGKLDRAGAESWLVQVLRHIDREKYKMDFLVHTTDAGAYDEEVRSFGARIIPCLNHTNPMRYARNFLRILRENGPYDVVHSHVHHFSGYVMLLAATGGVPIRIAHSHTTGIDPTVSVKRSSYLRLTKWLVKKYATAGTAVSLMAGDCLFPEGWRSDPRWQVAPCGIEFAPFDLPVDSCELRRELGIPANSVVVGHVARFNPPKNHAFVIEIAACLCELEPRAFFLMVGDGPLRAQIEGEVKRQRLGSRFMFLGVREDVARLMKGAMDLFLFPSLHEGLGIVVMEAQLAGLRCLLSRTVPPEADIFPELIRRESLGTPALRWAHVLMELVKSDIRVSTEEYAKQRVARSIKASVDHLVQDYGNRDLGTETVQHNYSMINGRSLLKVSDK